MDELSAQEIEAFRARLEERRRALAAEDEAGESWRATVELDQQSVGRLSRMDAIQQQAMAQATERRRRDEAARVESALRRIGEGDYGWCAKCGEPIARARLEVDPTALHCIGCA